MKQTNTITQNLHRELFNHYFKSTPPIIEIKLTVEKVLFIVNKNIYLFPYRFQPEEKQYQYFCISFIYIFCISFFIIFHFKRLINDSFKLQLGYFTKMEKEIFLLKTKADEQRLFDPSVGKI